jgi:hypothetical protein
MADKVAAASGNDSSPILGIFLESVSLKRINLVPDHAGYRHRYAPRGLAANGQRRTRCCHNFKGFAAA